MNDISGAVLEDPDSTIHHAECSFVVQVHRPESNRDDPAMNRNQSLRNTPNDATIVGNEKRSTEQCEQSAYDTDMLDSSLGPQPYHLQASSIAERDQWMSAINTALRAYQIKKEEQARQGESALRMYQLRLRSFYAGLPFQTTTALLVAVNFVVTVLVVRTFCRSVGCKTKSDLVVLCSYM
jgi:hypothetical protein